MGRGGDEELDEDLSGPQIVAEPDFSREMIFLRPEIIASPYEQEKRVMIDIDNTLVPLLGAVRAVHPELEDADLSPGKGALKKDLAALGIDLDHVLQQFYSDTELMKKAGVFRQAQEVMSLLSAHGLEIHIVSSRPLSAQKETELFLQEAGISYDHLSLGQEDKLRYCQEADISVLVDDDPELIQRAESEGRDAISFAWSHSLQALREYGGMEANTWQEIGHHTLDAVETNIRRRNLRESEDPKSIQLQAHDMNMMLQASEAGLSGTCLRRRVGAVIINTDGEIINTGSNQSPKGTPSCEEVGCLTDASGRCQRTVHAEVSAILAAPQGSLVGSTLYCTDRPCLGCAKLIAHSGVRRVVYARPYHAEATEVDQMFSELGVEVAEIAAAHQDLRLPPGGPRAGLAKPADQPIVN